MSVDNNKVDDITRMYIRLSFTAVMRIWTSVWLNLVNTEALALRPWSQAATHAIVLRTTRVEIAPKLRSKRVITLRVRTEAPVDPDATGIVESLQIWF